MKTKWGEGFFIRLIKEGKRKKQKGRVV